MRRIKHKRFICSILSAIMCLSFSACGKNDTLVESYGGVENSKEVSENVSSENDAIATQNYASLQDFYGEKVEWNDEFAVNGIPFKVNCLYDIPDAECLNVYNNKLLDDGKADEESIVKSLFGSTAKKLEEIKYTNETDYMTLLYKYRSIIDNHTEYEDNAADESYIYADRIDRTVIDSSFDKTYKWLDESNLYIHMYEGKYEGERFVLLLAYDYTYSERYIFFEPVSIKEYFPDCNYETLLVARSNNSVGKPLEIDNACSKSLDEIEKDAVDLLTNEFKLKGYVSVTTKPDIYVKNNHDDISSFMSDSVVMIGSYTRFDKGPSMLMFSDSDYISTIKTGCGSDGVAYSVLAEQEDLYTEYKKNHDTSIYEYISSESNAINSAIKETNFTADGYAVYLDPGYCDIYENSYALEPCSSNSGIIKYTSKGIYGVDLKIMDEITDVVENVKLLEFDKVLESVKAELPEKFDAAEFNKPRTVTIQSFSLSYYSYREDENSDTFSSIPVWEMFIMGDVTSSTGSNMGVVYVNAMDGSIMDIHNWGF